MKVFVLSLLGKINHIKFTFNIFSIEFNGFITHFFSLLLANKLAWYSYFFSFIANVLSNKNNVLSVWRLIISNLLLLLLVYNK